MRILNYMPLMITVVERVGLGKDFHVRILHDDWCPLVNGGEDCICNPEIGEVWIVDPGQSGSS